MTTEARGVGTPLSSVLLTCVKSFVHRSEPHETSLALQTGRVSARSRAAGAAMLVSGARGYCAGACAPRTEKQAAGKNAANRVPGGRACSPTVLRPAIFLTTRVPAFRGQRSQCLPSAQRCDDVLVTVRDQKGCCWRDGCISTPADTPCRH